MASRSDVAQLFHRTVLTWHKISEISATSKRRETSANKACSKPCWQQQAYIFKNCVRVEGAERHAQSDGSGDSRSSLAGEVARWGPDAIMKRQWLCGKGHWLHSPGALSWGLRRMWCDRQETFEARRPPHRSLGTRDHRPPQGGRGADSLAKQGN